MSLESIYKFSPDGTRLAVVSPDGRLAIWNSNSGKIKEIKKRCLSQTGVTAASMNMWAKNHNESQQC